MKPFNYRPFVFCGLSAAAGVVSSAFTSVRSPFIPLIIPLALAIAAIVGFAVSKRREILFHSVIYVLIFCVCSLQITRLIDLNLAAPFYDGEVAVTGTVKDVMTYSSATDRTFVVIGDLSSDGSDLAGSATANADGKVEIGDRVFIRGTAEKVDYSNIDVYMFPSGVFYNFKNVSESAVLSTGSGFFYGVRTGLKGILYENCTAKTFPFALALLTGETIGTDYLSFANFRAAGISHIFAVSGLHIGFIAALASLIMRLLGVRRLKNAVAVLVVTLLYSGVCGFPVSAIRATIICFVYGAARSLGRKPDPLNAVFLSMTIVLTLFPNSLFSLGFLLSFAAVVGIATLKSGLRSALGFMNAKVSEAFAVTISAFLFTAPIIACISGSVSLVTILSNFLFLPLASAVYYVLIACAVVTAAFPFMSSVFVVANGLISFITDAVDLVSFERFLIYGEMTKALAAFYYGTLVLSSDKINVGSGVRRAFACAASLSLILFI